MQGAEGCAVCRDKCERVPHSCSRAAVKWLIWPLGVGLSDPAAFWGGRWLCLSLLTWTHGCRGGWGNAFCSSGFASCGCTVSSGSWGSSCRVLGVYSFPVLCFLVTIWIEMLFGFTYLHAARVLRMLFFPRRAQGLQIQHH